MVAMYIDRFIQPTLKKALETFPAIVITGCRQSGKTTLVKHFLGNKWNYVSLDELDIRSFALDDPREFLAKNKTPLIIDEIQHAPELLSYIKAFIDRGRKPGQFIITGSQAFAVMRQASESLAGRAAILHLYPFSLAEMNNNLQPKLESASSFLDFLTQVDSPKHNSLPCGKWLLRGGYPELFVNHKILTRLWFSSYLQTYIDRDVRGNIKNANLSDFERFVRLLASRTAQELNCSNLARDVGVTVPTIKSWLSFLESSAIIYLLHPYHKNFGKRIIKSPKCYFVDTGLAAYLAGLQDEEHLLQGPMAGALFETACVIQFVKRFSALLDPASLYFWRSVDGFEVDLLIEVSNKLFPIEFKLSSTISSRHASGLKAWLKLTNKSSSEGIIISTSKQNGRIAENITCCNFSWL